MSHDFEQFLKLVKTSCIIGGDFNGYHTGWESSFIDHSARAWLEVNDNFSVLIIRNLHPSTWIKTPNGNISAADVTILTANAVDNYEWRVRNDI